MFVFGEGILDERGKNTLLLYESGIWGGET